VRLFWKRRRATIVITIVVIVSVVVVWERDVIVGCGNAVVVIIHFVTSRWWWWWWHCRTPSHHGQRRVKQDRLLTQRSFLFSLRDGWWWGRKQLSLGQSRETAPAAILTTQ
jgi:hypothetical protein